VRFPTSIINFIFIFWLSQSQARMLADNPSPIFINTLTLDLTLLGDVSIHDPDALVIPVRRVNRLIVIEAKIDTLIGNFILDTGAPELIVNKTYFRNWWYKTDVMATSATGSMATVQRTRTKELTIRTWRIPKINANVTELGHIENRCGLKILGLLGVSVFKGTSITLDLNNNVLIVHTKPKQNETLLDLKDKIPLFKTSIDLSNGAILLKGKIADKKLTFCFDTGAETTVLHAGLSDKILNTFEVNGRKSLLGTGGSRLEVLYGNLTSFTIEKYEILNAETIITNLDALSHGYGTRIDLMIGYDLIRKGIIHINFSAKTFTLYPHGSLSK
jgi:hypothetical protein